MECVNKARTHNMSLTCMRNPLQRHRDMLKNTLSLLKSEKGFPVIHTHRSALLNQDRQTPSHTYTHFLSATYRGRGGESWYSAYEPCIPSKITL